MSVKNDAYEHAVPSTLNPPSQSIAVAAGPVKIALKKARGLPAHPGL
jgi:hypothetical protein